MLLNFYLIPYYEEFREDYMHLFIFNLYSYIYALGLLFGETFFNELACKNCSFSLPYCGRKRKTKMLHAPDMEINGMGIELSQLQFFNCQIKT